MKIDYQPFLPKTNDQQKHYIQNSILGFAAGSCICVLTTTSLTALALTGFGCVGIIGALALSFFSLKQTKATDLLKIAPEKREEFATKLHEKNLLLAEADSYLVVYDPSDWAYCIDLFAKSSSIQFASEREKWIYAKGCSKKFLQFLVQLKIQKDPNLAEFTFFKHPFYLPIVETRQCLIPNKKDELLKMLDGYITLVLDRVLQKN